MSSDHSQEILACLSAHDFDLLLLSASTGFRFTSAPCWHDHCAMRGEVTLSGFPPGGDRKSTRLNSNHSQISYAVFCLTKIKFTVRQPPPPTVEQLNGIRASLELPNQMKGHGFNPPVSQLRKHRPLPLGMQLGGSLIRR